MSGRRDRGVDYLRLGQGLLLLGALVGFMYWRSTAECEDGRVQLLMFLKVAAFLLELLILVSVCISLAQMTSTQDEADELNPFDVHEINDNTGRARDHPVMEIVPNKALSLSLSQQHNQVGAGA